jgi:hypothetical protein
MAFVNLPPSLQALFDDIRNRLTKLENSQRFTLPVVATDPPVPRIGDMWLNTTTNQIKAVGVSGVVSVVATLS